MKQILSNKKGSTLRAHTCIDDGHPGSPHLALFSTGGTARSSRDSRSFEAWRVAPASNFSSLQACSSHSSLTTCPAASRASGTSVEAAGAGVYTSTQSQSCLKHEAVRTATRHGDPPSFIHDFVWIPLDGCRESRNSGSD